MGNAHSGCLWLAEAADLAPRVRRAERLASPTSDEQLSRQHQGLYEIVDVCAPNVASIITASVRSYSSKALDDSMNSPLLKALILMEMDKGSALKKAVVSSVRRLHD